MFLRDWHHIIGLTVSDLRFDWILSLCMVLALGAVFSPLFILLGLREGIIGTMLDKLNSDPVSRLVTPKLPLQQVLDEPWLESLRERAQVVIVSPVPRLLLDVEGVKEPVNVIPTTAEDPLLIGYDLNPPTEGLWVVLSRRLAEITGKGAGDVLQITLVRSAPREERVPVELRVAGVLPAIVSDDPKLWIPQSVFRWFNGWRRGLPMPELGLAGSGVGLTPEYDGILTLLSRVPSDEDYRRMIAGRTSFSQIPQPVDRIGWERPKDRQARLWMPVNSRALEGDIVSLLSRHHELGYDADAVPYLDRFPIRLTAGEQTATLSLTVLPEEPKVGPADGHSADRPQVWIATGAAIGAEITGMISFTTASGREVKIPVRLVSSTALQDGFAAVPRALAGKMNAARRQEAFFDPATGVMPMVTRVRCAAW
jgi:putative ABC transport system permease protein